MSIGVGGSNDDQMGMVHSLKTNLVGGFNPFEKS